MIAAYENVQLSFTLVFLINISLGQYATYYNYPRAPSTYNQYTYPFRQQKYFYSQNQKIVPTYFNARNTPNSYYLYGNGKNNLALQNAATLQQLDNSAKLKRAQLFNQNKYKIPKQKIIYYNKEPTLKPIFNVQPYKNAKDEFNRKELISMEGRLKSDEYYGYDDYVEGNSYYSYNDQAVIDVKLSLTNNDNTKSSNKHQKMENDKNKVKYKSKGKDVNYLTIKMPKNKPLDAFVNKIAKSKKKAETKKEIMENKHTDLNKIDESIIKSTKDIYYEEKTNIDDAKESRNAYLVRAIDGRIIILMQSYIEFLNSSNVHKTYTEDEEITNYLINNWQVNSSITTMLNYILEQESIDSKIKNLVKLVQDVKDLVFYKYLISRLYDIALKKEPNLEDLYFQNWAIYFYDALQQIKNEIPHTIAETDIIETAPPSFISILQREHLSIPDDISENSEKLHINQYVLPMSSNEYIKKQTKLSNENRLNTLIQDELSDDIDSNINEGRGNKTLEVKKQSIRSVSPTMPVDVASEAQDIENYSNSENDTELIEDLPDDYTSNATELQTPYTNETVNYIEASEELTPEEFATSDLSSKPSNTEDTYNYLRPSTDEEQDYSLENLFHVKEEFPENIIEAELPSTEANFKNFGTSYIGDVNPLERVSHTQEYSYINISSQPPNIADTFDYLRELTPEEFATSDLSSKPSNTEDTYNYLRPSTDGEQDYSLENLFHVKEEFPKNIIEAELPSTEANFKNFGTSDIGDVNPLERVSHTQEYSSINISSQPPNIADTFDYLKVSPKVDSSQDHLILGETSVGIEHDLTDDFHTSNQNQSISGQLKIPPSTKPVFLDIKPHSDEYAKVCFKIKISEIQNLIQNSLQDFYNAILGINEDKELQKQTVPNNENNDFLNSKLFRNNENKNPETLGGSQVMPLDKHISKQYNYKPFYLDKAKNTERSRQYGIAKPVNNGRQIFVGEKFKLKQNNNYPFYLDKYKDTDIDGSQLSSVGKLNTKDYYYYPFYLDKNKGPKPSQKYEIAKLVNDGSQLSDADKLKSKKYNYYPLYFNKFKEREPSQQYDIENSVFDSNQVSSVDKLKPKNCNYYTFYLDTNKDTEPSQQYAIAQPIYDVSQVLGVDKLKSKQCRYSPSYFKKYEQIEPSQQYELAKSVNDGSSLSGMDRLNLKDYNYYPFYLDKYKDTKPSEKYEIAKPIYDGKLESKKKPILYHKNQLNDDKTQEMRIKQQTLTEPSRASFSQQELYIPDYPENYFHQLSLFALNSGDDNSPFIYFPNTVSEQNIKGGVEPKFILEHYNQHKLGTQEDNTINDDLKTTSFNKKLPKIQPLTSTNLKKYKPYEYLEKLSDLLQNRPSYKSNSEENISKHSSNVANKDDMIYQTNQTYDNHNTKHDLPYDQSLKHKHYNSFKVSPEMFKYTESNELTKEKQNELSNSNDLSNLYNDNLDRQPCGSLINSPFHYKCHQQKHNDKQIRNAGRSKKNHDSEEQNKVSQIQANKNMPQFGIHKDVESTDNQADSVDLDKKLKFVNEKMNDQNIVMEGMPNVQKKSEIFKNQHKINKEDLSNPYNELLKTEVVIEGQYSKPYKKIDSFDKPGLVKHTNIFSAASSPYRNIYLDKIAQWPHETMDVIDDEVIFESSNNQNDKSPKIEVVTDSQNSKPYEEMAFDKRRIVQTENKNFNDDFSFLYGDIENAKKISEWHHKTMDGFDEDVSFEKNNNQNDELLIKEIINETQNLQPYKTIFTFDNPSKDKNDNVNDDILRFDEVDQISKWHHKTSDAIVDEVTFEIINNHNDNIHIKDTITNAPNINLNEKHVILDISKPVKNENVNTYDKMAIHEEIKNTEKLSDYEEILAINESNNSELLLNNENEIINNLNESLNINNGFNQSDNSKITITDDEFIILNGNNITLNEYFDLNDANIKNIYSINSDDKIVNKVESPNSNIFNYQNINDHYSNVRSYDLGMIQPQQSEITIIDDEYTDSDGYLKEDIYEMNRSSQGHSNEKIKNIDDGLLIKNDELYYPAQVLPEYTELNITEEIFLNSDGLFTDNINKTGKIDSKQIESEDQPYVNLNDDKRESYFRLVNSYNKIKDRLDDSIFLHNNLNQPKEVSQEYSKVMIVDDKFVNQYGALADGPNEATKGNGAIIESKEAVFTMYDNIYSDNDGLQPSNINIYDDQKEYYLNDASDYNQVKPGRNKITYTDERITELNGTLVDDLHKAIEINGEIIDSDEQISTIYNTDQIFNSKHPIGATQTSVYSDANKNKYNLNGDYYPAIVNSQYGEKITVGDHVNNYHGIRTDDFKDDKRIQFDFKEKESSEEYNAKTTKNESKSHSDQNRYHINNKFYSTPFFYPRHSELLITDDEFINSQGQTVEDIHETFKENGETVESEEDIIIHGPEEFYDAKGSISIPKDYRREETDSPKNTNVTVKSTQLRRFLAKFHHCFGFYPESHSNGDIIGFNFNKNNLMKNSPPA